MRNLIGVDRPLVGAGDGGGGGRGDMKECSIMRLERAPIAWPGAGGLERL